MKVIFEVELEVETSPSPRRKYDFTEALQEFNETISIYGTVCKSTWKLPPEPQR